MWNLLICLFAALTLCLAMPASAAPGIHASKSTAVASPTTVLADGVAVSTITVTVRRANGVTAGSGISVTLTASGGSSIISTSPALTNNAGVATFTVRDATVEQVTYTAVATESGSGSVIISQRPIVNFVRAAPTVAKSFNPSTIAANGTTTLTITLTNPNTASISGATFTDIYPANMVNAGPPAVSTTCGGTATAVSAGGSVALSGGTIPAASSCTVTVTVTSPTAGSYTNNTGAVTSTNAASGASASATLTVLAISAANSTVTASPTTVLANGISTSTITVTLRDGANLAVSGKTVTLTKSGGSSTISAASGTSDANGVVTFTVKDTVAETATYTARDTTDNIQVTQTASVTFVLVPIFKSFATSPIAANGTSLLSVTLTNSAGVSVTGAGFTDPYPSGLVNAGNPSASGSCGAGVVTGATGTSSLGISGATIAANSACTVSVQVTSATAGTYSNTATNTASSSSTASLVVTAISATNSTVTASPTSVLANGIDSSTITVTLKDGAGNPVPGKSVSLRGATGNSVITAISNVGGVATFKVTYTIAEGPITYIATDTTDEYPPGTKIQITQTASVTFTRITAPTVTKTFSPGTIADYGTSTLTVTLTNPNTGSINGVEFTDTYPGGLTNFTPRTLTSTCGGGNPGTADGGTTLSLSDGTIPASGSCSVSVQVTASFPGTAGTSAIDNFTGAVTSSNALSGTSAKGTLNVVDVSATNSTVVANPTSVPADNSTTSTITVTLRDGGGNPVSGKDVTLAKSAGSSATIALAAAGSDTTDGNGMATFTTKDSVTEAVTYTAQDSTDGITITQQAVVTFGSYVGSFNAFEASTAASAVTGKIYTKLAGTAFSLDVVAISGGAKATGFSNAVTVELLGNQTTGIALDGNGCPTSSTLIQTVSPTPTISSGRSTVNFAAVANAWRDVRVRIRYLGVTPNLTSCSTDNFSIRPTAFVVTSTDAINTGSSGTPAIKTGANFNLTAAARVGASAVTGYNGIPKIDNTKVLGSPTAGAIGGIFNAAPPGTGIASGSNFYYSEVGNFGLDTNGVYDDTFTGVDAPGTDPSAWDCTADFSILLAGSGKYGCSVGSVAILMAVGSSGFGRFIPDNFLVTYNTPSFDAACGGFTYIGQKFVYATAPVMTVTARNGTSNGLTNLKTANYADAYMKMTTLSLTPASQAARYSRYDELLAGATPGLDAASFPATATDPTIAFANGEGTLTFSSGSSGFAFSRSTTTVNRPFNADIALALNVIDTDGVAFAGNPAKFGDATAGNGIAFGGGNKAMRYGRLKVSSAHGSELLNLPIPMEAQYYTGVAFVRNDLDNCTNVAAKNVAMTNYRRNLGPISSCKTAASINLAPSADVGAAFIGGRGDLRLALPGSGNNGSVDLTINLNGEAGNTCVAKGGTMAAATSADLSYLRGNWTGSTYTESPKARATFGIYKSGPVIYMREMY